MYRLGAWISWERNFTSRCRWNHSCWGSWGVKKCAGGAALASTRWPHAQYHLDGQPLLPACTKEWAGVTWRTVWAGVTWCIVWAGVTNYSVGRSLLLWCRTRSLHLILSPIYIYLTHTQTQILSHPLTHTLRESQPWAHAQTAQTTCLFTSANSHEKRDYSSIVNLYVNLQ